MNEESIKQELNEEENLILSTKPERKLFTKNELIRIPISFVLIGGFLVYYHFFAQIDAKVNALTIAIAAVFILYNVVIKTTIKAIKRNRTTYVLTDKRVIFLLSDRKGNKKRSVSFKISDIISCSVAMNKDGTGSVIFSETKETVTYPLKEGNNWIPYPGGVAPFFFDIVNPEEVRDRFLDIKQTYVKQVRESNDLVDRPFSKFDE